MSRHDDRISLRHMLEHSAEAAEMIRGRSRDELDRDRKLNLALVRLMEIVGEAAARVSQEFRRFHPNIPWSRVVGLRNRLIHGYDEVDFDVLWRILQEDIPQLIPALRRVLDAGAGDDSR
ncbi:MAG: DUF86 domain-containing protein [Phycisphaerales bacterium]|nr:DUF86 domain-containing protein [Phycisphaerales bacterium]